MTEPIEQGFRLSPQQLRAWRLQKDDAASCAIVCALRLEGDLDRPALRRALAATVARHEILRTAFRLPAGLTLPLQVILDPGPVSLPEADLGGLSPDQRSAGAAALLSDLGGLPFRLEQGEGWRAALVRLGPCEHEMQLALSAVCADPVAFETLAADLLAAYADQVAGRERDPEPPLQVVDVAEWQNSLLEGVDATEGLETWRDHWREQDIEGRIALPLPLQEREAAPGPFAPREEAVPLAPETAGELARLAAAWEHAPQVLLLTAWKAVIQRGTGRDESLVGVLYLGRDAEELRGVVGPLARYLPVTARFGAESSLREAVAQVRKAMKKAEAWGEYFSWEHVNGSGNGHGPGHGTSGFPLCFEAGMNGWTQAADGLRASAVRNGAVLDRFALSLSWSGEGEQLRLALRYDPRRFRGEAVRRLAGRLAALLGSVAARPDAPLADHPAMAEDELGRWLELSVAPPAGDRNPRTLHAVFEEQADRAPDRVAVVAGDGSLTFRDLDERANRLAHHLRAAGAGPERVVALCLERSAEAVVALLAVWKAGAAYVPLDPTQPVERLAWILEDTETSLLVTDSRLAPGLPGAERIPGLRTVRLDAEAPAIARRPAGRLPAEAGPRDLAYVIYTSGSTGRPKGVLVEHRSALHLLAALEAAVLDPLAEAGLLPEPLLASLNAPMIFDASVQQLALLLAGHALCVVPQDVRADGGALLDFLRENGVGLLDCTPSQLRLLVEAGLLDGAAGPRIVLTAGEAVDEPLWRRLAEAERTVCFNLYGPTECSVDATFHRIQSSDTRPTIGRPLAGYEVFLLDPTHQPVPTGAPGELCLGGAGLARGYLRRPDLTAERFVPHPFATRPGERLYRTGDLGRHLPEGDLEFLGRLDHQVKIRGVRIELGEIEAVLTALAGVREAVVVAHQVAHQVTHQDASGDQRLVAYVTGDATADALRQALRERLPESMMPAAFVRLAALPLTPNGKVDRKALPEPVWQAAAETWLAPRTPVEEVLAGIWAEVLGLERVGAADQFFDLGGHSLLATQVMSRLRSTFDVEMPLRELFTTPRLEDLAARIEEALRAGEQQRTPPLLPVPREGSVPLSFAQQRLWFIDQLEPGSALYNMPVALRAAGPLDAAVLALCFGEVVRRHEVLRTVFAAPEGSPAQVIRPAGPFGVPVVDLSGLPESTREALALALVAEEAGRPFDLTRGPLLRCVLLRLAQRDHVVALTMHHIVSDGWSMGILVREVAALYAALADENTGGKPSPLPELPVQYADFALWQRSWLHGEVLEGEISFWRRQLAGLPPLLELPIDRPRPAMQSYRGAALPVRLPAGLTRQIKALGRREGATLFMALLAAFQTLLARAGGQDDLAVGSPVAGRNRVETEGLIGFFINTLVLRGSLAGQPSFAELLGRVRETALTAYLHQDVPFEKLVEELAPERSLAHTPLFQVMLVLQNLPAEPIEMGRLVLSPVATESGPVKLDLSLGLEERDGELAGSLRYATDLFDRATVLRLVGHLEQLLTAATATPQRPVADLEILSPAQRSQLLVEWNDTAQSPPALPVHRLIALQAERKPNAIAVRTDTGSLTYGELAARVRLQARRLRALGAGPEQLVAVCLERSTELVATLLAVLASGASYLPLNPRDPEERRVEILEDARPLLLLTEKAVAAGPEVVRTLRVEDWEALPAVADEAAPDTDEPANARAYVLYTSGSTGKPKGVEVDHASLSAYLAWIGGVLEEAGVRWLPLLSSVTFDASLKQLFVPLLRGETVRVAPEDALLRPARLLEILGEAPGAGCNTVPALWEGLLSALEQGEAPPPADLRALFLGGERLPEELVARTRRTLPSVAIYNLYGPTEATANAAWSRLEEGGGVPLGRPVGSTRIVLADRDLQPVPLGALGEICVGGTAVARGYRGRPELTAEWFRPDPFSPSPGARLYRTGDLARQRTDGTLDSLGRLDHQVKIRGFRIELGEIEAALVRLPGVREAVVMAREDGAPGARRLVAYVVGDASPETLRGALRERLPDAMVPATFVTLATLPLTANGKVDRKALPAPELPGTRDGYLAPRTREEEILAAVWAQVLRLPRVGVNDNFFELGGDSILSIQIVARARQAGLLFTVRQVFEHQTVAELARHARAADPAGARAAQEPVAGEVPLTPIQRWFFEQGFAEPHHYNQALLLEAREPLDPAALECAVAALVEHHDALRMRFEVQDQTAGGWRQENAPAEPATPFHRVDLSSLPEPRRRDAFGPAVAAVQAGFDLQAGPLTRLCLFHFDAGQPAQLLWVTHHLVVDGVSWRVLVEDLEEAYRQASRGQRVALPPKTTSFQEWARRLDGHAGSEALVRELVDWSATAQVSVPRLPVDFSEEGHLVGNLVGWAATVSFELGAEETADLLQTLPAVYHSRIDDALLSALVRALAGWTGSPRLLVDLEGHGREPLFDDLDVSRTVGWFTTLYPIVLEAGDAGPGDALVSAKERLRAVPGRGIGYGLLRYLGSPGEAHLLKAVTAAPPAEISFNYLGQVDSTSEALSLFQGSGAFAGPTRSPRAHRGHALEITGIVAQGRLRINLTYGSRTHRRETIEHLAAAYAGTLRELIQHGRESAEVFTPSDFAKARLDVRSFNRLASLLSDPAEPVESLAGGLGLTLKNVADVYPLTPLQSGMLFHSLMAPESGVYVNQVTCTLPADLDARLFRQTWERLIARHGVLRTAFLWDGLDEPRQVVRKSVSLPWQELDWRGLPTEEQQRRFEALRQSDRHAPLPLEKAPLMRFSLVRLDQGHGFIWTSHHLLTDGWSIPLLVQELSSVYVALREGREPVVPPTRPFSDYIAWLQRQDAARAEPFWRQELAGFAATNSLGISRPAGAGTPEASGSAEHKSRLSREVTEKLQALAARHKLTLQTLTLGAWAVLVSRYSREEDVVFGGVVSGRPADLPGVETMIGLFINTLPVRARVHGAEPLAPWLQRLQERQLARRDFEHSPLGQIQRWSEVPAGSPLFETLYVFENYPSAEGDGSDSLRISNLRSFETTNYPITMTAAAADQIALHLMYDPAHIDEGAAPRLVHHLATLLTAMADGPRVLDDLSLFTAEEALQLRAGDPTSTDPVDRPLHAWIEDQADRSPGAVAITFENEPLTYRELDRRANRLARHLRALGVGPETRVAVLMERSTELVVALLAIFKAGGAYVPLDLAYPAERIAFLLTDSAATVLLTEGQLAEALPPFPGEIVRIDADRERIAALPAERLAVVGGPAHLAYIIYTSGSTGRPKGVQVTHANVLRLFAATQERFGFGPADVWTFFHSVAFDFSVWEIWGALLYGGRLVIVPHEVSRSPWLFLDLLVREQVTVLNQTPSAFAQLAQEDEKRGGAATDLRLVIFGGEALDLAGLAPWFARHGDETPLLVNMYGITETTVHVTARPVRAVDAREETRSLIGLPILDLSLTLVDPGLRPVPRGVPGELAVGGAGLARGYLGRPELTAERFVPDPLGGSPGARLYRSGDLGRLLANGDVEYLGRIDHQVKIRGFRIELGEIEAALAAHPRVREAVVVARDGSGPGNRRLVAYLVIDGEAEGEAPPVDELRRTVGERLPDYMVPAAFVALDSFPLTPHGKVDRKALPEPGTDRPGLEQPFVAPATPEEAAWAEVWREVLGVDRVGVQDNFFALGGDSIRSIQILARARERGLTATLQEIYQRQTIQGLLAGQVDAPARPAAEILPFGLLAPGERERLPATIEATIEDAYPLALLQAGMLFHSEYSPETAVFHDVFSYHVRSPLDLEALCGAVQELAGRHAILRTSFLLAGPGEPLQLINQEVEIPVGVTDLRSLAPAEQRAVLSAWIEKERHRGFDWTVPPLLRFHVHRRSDDSFQLTLSFHHALLDGWSVATLFSELFQGYVFRIGQGPAPAPAPALRSAFRDFVALEREALASDEQREFWRRGLADRTATLLPRWPSRGPSSWSSPAERGGRNVRRHRVPFSTEISEGLQRLASSLGVPVKSALLAAHLRVLQLLTGQVDLITGLVANGRPEERDGERVLGLFLNTLPFRLELRGGTWRDLVRQTFAAERERLPFRRFPLAETQRMLGGQPLFETVFNFVSFHVYASTPGLSDLEILEAEAVEETNFPLGASFSLDPASSRLQLTLDWGTAELWPEQVEAMAGYYARTLAAMAATPDGRFEEAVLLAPEEIQLLEVEANDTWAASRSHLCVHQLFEEQAARFPERTALILDDKRGGQRLTYGELNEWANRLARRLRALGVGPETVVGLCAERSFEAIAGIFGVLKAGGAYLPLDPAYPPERLSFLLEDARVSVLLCQERLLGILPAHGARVVPLDAVAPEEPEIREHESQDHEAWEPGSGATPLHPAYVIYTSGSTGLPKGVVALHGGLANFALAMVEEIGLGPSHRFLQFASLSFDASAVQIFPTLVSGATLVLHPDPSSLSSHEILRLCERHGVTVLDLPAALWRQFVEDTAADGLGSAPLSVFLTGGESVSVARLRSWAAAAPPGARFLSSYGPTEATVTTTFFTVAREQVDALDGRLIPLGRRLPNVRVHLLDRHLQPVPLAVPGEVCIGGAGITRGYFGRPDLTAQAFIPDPFATEPGARLYRTGDMARRIWDGHHLEFLGRFDDQVKVRGFRVEPGEIETALTTCAEVAHAAVVIREDAPGDVRLVAYVVPQPDLEIDLRTLRGALQEKLPPHMVPTAFVVLDALPVTAHGKLDRQALPAPEGAGLDGDRPYREPRTPVEQTLAQIWSEILKVERAGLDDGFFALGGHSLIAVRMIGRLREAFRVDLPLRALYETATLAELAQAIELLQAGGTEAAAPSPEPPPLLQPDPAGRFLPFPLTPIQQVYWTGQSELFELGGSGSNIYNELEVSGLLDVFIARLMAALPLWVERHEMLRSVVLPDGRQQILERVPPYKPEVMDLRGVNPWEVRDRLEAARGRLRFAQAVAGEWPPFEIVLFRLDGDRLRICSRISALILDGTSRRIMIEDLFRLVDDPGAPFPALDLSFRDYAVARAALRGSEAGRRSRDFWMKRLPGLPPAPDLPRVREARLPTRPHFVIRQLELLDAESWERLRDRAARAGLTPTGATLAAFVDVLASFAGSPRFTLSLVGSERFPLHPRIGEVAGNFNTVHLLEVDGWEGPFEARARRLRDRLASDLEFPYFSGLEVLRELNRLRGNRDGAAMPVLFNSIIEYNETRGEQAAGTPEPGGDAPVRLRDVELNIYSPQILLSPTVMESGDGRLVCKWQAVEDAFPPGLISGLAAAFERRLRALAGHEEAWQAAPEPPVAPAEIPEHRGSRNAEDAEEEEVAALWRDLLGTGGFGMRDDFFAAGGDSFGIVRLVSGLEEMIAPGSAARTFLRERLMAAFVQEATVENLAAVVRRERAARTAEARELALSPA
jgi:amino acid adenylation domain-containing protein/non-ribosomal peptide synthase protein (TIGR01720 family)